MASPGQSISVKKNNRFLRYSAADYSTATITAMIIQPVETTAVFYVYGNKTEKDWTTCTLRYKLNNSDAWTTVTDNAYPFEFDMVLPSVEASVSFQLTATDHRGRQISFVSKTIND